MARSDTPCAPPWTGLWRFDAALGFRAKSRRIAAWVSFLLDSTNKETDMSLSSWLRKVTSSAQSKHVPRPGFRPGLEALEDRFAPALVPLTVHISSVGARSSASGQLYTAVLINGVSQDTRSTPFIG